MLVEGLEAGVSEEMFGPEQAELGTLWKLSEVKDLAC